MRAPHRVTWVFAFLLVASLQAQSPLPPGTWRIADVPPELKSPVSRADLIVVSMQDALLRELTRTIEEGGPDLAIKSCHIDVIEAIQRIGRYEGIAAGRTSDRLRNPTNAPQPWAAPFVSANAGRRARDVPGSPSTSETSSASCGRSRIDRCARRTMDLRMSSVRPFATSSGIDIHATARSALRKGKYGAGSGSKCPRN
jgi:hypothetical protein